MSDALNPAFTSTWSDKQLKDLALLKIYYIYRLLLAIALLSTFIFDPYQTPILGSLKPQLFFVSAIGYLILNGVALFALQGKKTPIEQPGLFVHFFLDILALLLLLDSSGGISSGVGILMVVVIAASGIMLGGQLAMLIAAITSLSVLTDTLLLVNQGHLAISAFLPAGLLGMILFITALFIQNLAARIRGAQKVAEQRAADVNKLQQLNQQIVQRMRTGILVTDQQGHIYLANDAAAQLLAEPSWSNDFAQASKPMLQPTLLKQFRRWQEHPHFHIPPFQATDSGPEIHASFSAIGEEGGDEHSSDILVFLEDNRQLVQRAQQMKLASLGRLTASIAHEIRNPLGAISHAGQLLAESTDISPADQRLCDIIHDHTVRMNKVIENVLQISSRGATNPDKLMLPEWLQRFIQDFENNRSHNNSHNNSHDNDNQQQTITLVSDGQPHEVKIDSSQLTQVITNLAVNGLRYSYAQTGTATLTLHVHAHPITGLSVLDIIDDGPGVSEQAKQSIFEPFYTTETTGSGLGLYISRELCEANEARLDYIRTNEGKSCFRISFPHPQRRLFQE